MGILDSITRYQSVIPFDDHNPIIHEFSETDYPEFSGWKWVVLRTDVARERERSVREYCAFAGVQTRQPAGCIPIPNNERVLSLRTPEGLSVFSLYCDESGCLAPINLWDCSVCDRYMDLVSVILGYVIPRILLNVDFLQDIPDGFHTNDWVKFYVQNQRLHRDDGPAVIKTSGLQSWYFNGLLHRDDGPAVVEKSGGEYWYDTGRLHRLDGPAISRADGSFEWFVHGQRHRENGPAIEDVTGTQYWYFQGQLHRDDGPAYIGVDGTREWSHHGKLHRDNGPAVERADGQKSWYRYGILHRIGGPAVVQDQLEFWFVDGQLHRTDGPAVIYKTGLKEWYLNGQRHREDGPAIQYADGHMEFYLNGSELTKQDFLEW